jgi:hypothetical protein
MTAVIISPSRTLWTYRFTKFSIASRTSPCSLRCTFEYVDTTAAVLVHFVPIGIHRRFLWKSFPCTHLQYSANFCCTHLQYSTNFCCTHLQYTTNFCCTHLQYTTNFVQVCRRFAYVFCMLPCCLERNLFLVFISHISKLFSSCNWHCSVQHLSSCFLSKYTKMKTYKTVLLCVV